jgi:hypothetical protein
MEIITIVFLALAIVLIIGQLCCFVWLLWNGPVGARIENWKYKRYKMKGGGE